MLAYDNSPENQEDFSRFDPPPAPPAAAECDAAHRFHNALVLEHFAALDAQVRARGDVDFDALAEFSACTSTIVEAADGRLLPLIEPLATFAGGHAEFDRGLFAAGLREFCRAVFPSEMVFLAAGVEFVRVKRLAEGITSRRAVGLTFLGPDATQEGGRR